MFLDFVLFILLIIVIIVNINTAYTSYFKRKTIVDRLDKKLTKILQKMSTEETKKEEINEESKEEQIVEEPPSALENLIKYRKIMTTKAVKQFQIGFIGSTAHYGKTKELCKEIGYKVGTLQNVRFYTGGLHGIPETICNGLPGRAGYETMHIIPKELTNPDDYTSASGEKLVMGSTFEDRQEILAKCCDFVIMVEGGPGAQNEALLAAKNGAHVYVVPTSGIYAQRTYDCLDSRYPNMNVWWKELPEYIKTHDYTKSAGMDITNDLIAHAIVYDLRLRGAEHAFNLLRDPFFAPSSGAN